MTNESAVGRRSRFRKIPLEIAKLPRFLRCLFFILIVYPLVLIVLGLNVRRRHLLPTSGPALIIANHNSHLDALVLMTLLGVKQLNDVHPVAASDYFLKGKLRSWFSTHIIGIIPLKRTISGIHEDPLAPISLALKEGKILILFPEGSRGEPEQLAEFQSGIAHLAKRHPDVPVIPIFMHGLGKSLPRGDPILVPFFVDVFIGEEIIWAGNRQLFMQSLTERFKELQREEVVPDWT